jgi:hypothetical protein
VHVDVDIVVAALVERMGGRHADVAAESAAAAANNETREAGCGIDPLHLVRLLPPWTGGERIAISVGGSDPCLEGAGDGGGDLRSWAHDQLAFLRCCGSGRFGGSSDST